MSFSKVVKDALGESDEEGDASKGEGEKGALPALSDSENEGEKKEVTNRVLII